MPTVQRALAQYRDARQIHRPSLHAIDRYDSELVTEDSSSSARGSFQRSKSEHGRHSQTFEEILALKLNSSSAGRKK